MATDEGLQKQSFWLYGVIVGLAMEAALETVVPHLFAYSSGKPWHYTLETARLIVFLVVIIRFYLGSVVFFDWAYASLDCHIHYPKKNYLIDFLFGLIHFLLFYGLALAIGGDNPTRLFPVLLLVILLYDVFWLFASWVWGYTTFHLIKMWAVVNVGTCIFAAGLYLATRQMGYDFAISQGVAFVPVIIVSCVDIAEVILGKRIIAHWLKRLVVTPHSEI